MNKFRIGNVVIGKKGIFPPYYENKKGRIISYFPFQVGVKKKAYIINWFNARNTESGFWDNELKRGIDFKQKIKFVKELL